MNTELPAFSSPDAQRSYQRLLPRLQARFAAYAAAHPQDWAAFEARLAAHFERLFTLLLGLYGGQYDFFYHLEMLLYALAEAWAARPPELKAMDAERERCPDWFQSNERIGGVCYVDRFAGDLARLRARIPYFERLGLTYLHLMPLFRTPAGENDGGYAISSYREVNPALGTLADLAALAADLRRAGISLVLDFVFNHTSDEHEWALRARAGDPDYQAFYRMFPDRSLPDAYERTLREIFPGEHPGAFTWYPDVERWVWTTFHSYQWDLNYANPAVFTAMAREMLALANLGVDVLRLDAVAFIWKQMGTGCENLPEAHRLIQAFNAAARIAAPGLLFKSEAIVHPDEVARYISPGECPISYNPLLMALLWESLATREVRLLAASMRTRYAIPPGCAWVNYVRCHDDIGWTFSDEDAARIGINGYDHRRFLNTFYTGRFPGSFGRGLPFQENPKTGDCRISGTCASLAGLEKALAEETAREVSLAVGRILLIHGVILTMGGIPLIYLGDEIAALNDYGYREECDSAGCAKAGDSRWVHRPRMDWARAEAAVASGDSAIGSNLPATGVSTSFPERTGDGDVEACAERAGDGDVEAHAEHTVTTEPVEANEAAAARVYAGLRRLIALRKREPVFAGGDCRVLESGHPAVFAYLRTHGGRRALVLANFSERVAHVPGELLRACGEGKAWVDLMRFDRLSEPLPERTEDGGVEWSALPLPEPVEGNGNAKSGGEPPTSTGSVGGNVEGSGDVEASADEACVEGTEDGIVEVHAEYTALPERTEDGVVEWSGGLTLAPYALVCLGEREG